MDYDQSESGHTYRIPSRWGRGSMEPAESDDDTDSTRDQARETAGGNHYPTSSFGEDGWEEVDPEDFGPVTDYPASRPPNPRSPTYPPFPINSPRSSSWRPPSQGDQSIYRVASSLTHSRVEDVSGKRISEQPDQREEATRKRRSATSRVQFTQPIVSRQFPPRPDSTVNLNHSGTDGSEAVHIRHPKKTHRREYRIDPPLPVRLKEAPQQRPSPFAETDSDSDSEVQYHRNTPLVSDYQGPGGDWGYPKLRICPGPLTPAPPPPPRYFNSYHRPSVETDSEPDSEFNHHKKRNDSDESASQV